MSILGIVIAVAFVIFLIADARAKLIAMSPPAEPVDEDIIFDPRDKR